ncbi:MAG: septum formation initiator family protein [Bacteroidales bacterium]|nr:septum formation initiator family protein [Bacteroidales bacterium]MCL2133361.1 septum formation initiator family protein [Bacteroidales bacterium]
MINWTKIKSKIPRFLRNKYVLTLLLFGVWITIFDNNSIISWVQNRMRLAKIETEQQNYRQLLNATSTAIEDLTNNNDSLEKFARENFGFHKDDEEVFIVED